MMRDAEETGEWTFKLTLVRHGETRGNRLKITQGQTDSVLSERGKQQVEMVAKRLKYERLTRLYSSDLLRALKTAEAICSQNVFLKNSKVHTDALLRERNYGEAEGKSNIDVREMLARGTLPRGAETDYEVKTRAVDFFNNLLEDINHIKNAHFREKISAKISQSISNENVNCEHVSGSSCTRCKSQHCEKDNTTSQQQLTDIKSTKNTELNDIKHGSYKNKHCSGYQLMTSSSTPLVKKKLSEKSVFPVLLKDLCFHKCEKLEDEQQENTVQFHIVVVSHSGILRHLITHFAQNFQSIFPIEKRKLLRQICPNTGLCELEVNMKANTVVDIDCTKLYDRSHLF
ncbi:fructose-2,6-bisphosphatase TIGAR-like isoform X1 [Xenia sp. Carnegie-2017]|uniref:fructose-2,6-bisphosphatase TIGAR-like isoform X1 n=1 Tax=Xenia sp. Carnegie-2017 TaxID=2897299 RepID=UPI001F043076|nr:fructose-2,6-bisphosphatase TIGAR-like isoform X1 [Xenia sp. Carnegie-2017]